MIVNQYAIKDELMEFTPGLLPFEKDNQAKRWFRDYVAGNSMMRKNPEDFSLWLVGTFNTKTGALKPILSPQLIERAKGGTNGNEEK